MQQLPMTYCGALINDAQRKIPETAIRNLNIYSNNRIKELKVVTKAFKYLFPFYDMNHAGRAFRKFFDIVKKYIENQIPYINNTKTEFINLGKPLNDTICINLGPCNTKSVRVSNGELLYRYTNRLHRLIRQKGIPIIISEHQSIHTELNPLNSLDTIKTEVFEIRISIQRSLSDHGYLLLYYLPEILKILITLHRKAHYADPIIGRS